MSSSCCEAVAASLAARSSAAFRASSCRAIASSSSCCFVSPAATCTSMSSILSKPLSTNSIWSFNCSFSCSFVKTSFNCSLSCAAWPSKPSRRAPWPSSWPCARCCSRESEASWPSTLEAKAEHFESSPPNLASRCSTSLLLPSEACTALACLSAPAWTMRTSLWRSLSCDSNLCVAPAPFRTSASCVVTRLESSAVCFSKVSMDPRCLSRPSWTASNFKRHRLSSASMRASAALLGLLGSKLLFSSSRSSCDCKSKVFCTCSNWEPSWL
mmetsp:Transcript_26710/g.76452  ORF Transcript_26710/g.76452 Transcript_26710/m.76452 type:complete len:270 (-) Transcript_26710:446-1255(-)